MRSVLLRVAARQTSAFRQSRANLSLVARPSSFLLSSGLDPSRKPCYLQRFSSTALAEDEPVVSGVLADEESSNPLRRFEDLDLHPKSLKALRRQGLHNLTEIQEKTFDVIVSGKDVVGRARTGTGKTLSFLLPALERVVRKQEQNSLPPGIPILILSPTRELAAQISKEADLLVAQHGPEISSQVVFGGSSRREDIGRFEKQLPTVLVATPGRLKDHLASTQLHGKEPFIDAFQNLQILVLDETDRLLDMGFRRDVTDILSCLPRKRQTLLFSATLPRDVREVVELATRPVYEMVDCIQDEDPATQTNAQTQQSHIILPADQFWTKTFEFLLNLVDKGDNKVMVFFPMTSMVELYAQVFNNKFGRRVWELHGKMHQRERTTISRRFRNATKGILFTSDVSARGVDYPNVTDVVQIGACESRETYIHRLGRTGRAGKIGRGYLILPELERDFLRELEGLDVPVDPELEATLVLKGPSKKLLDEFGPMAQRIRKGKDPKLQKTIHDLYQAMIPYYFQRCKDKPREVVATSNRLIEVMGVPELPAIELTRARRLGLDGVPGINIKSQWKDQNWTTGWGEEGASSAPTRFGKPYGDFDGKFGYEDRPYRKHTSESQEGRRKKPNRSDDRKTSDDRRGGKASGRRSSWQDYGGQMDNRRRRKEESENDARPNQYNSAFSKVGPKKNTDEDFPGKPAFAKKGKPKNTFERWEAPGEFRFRK
jgi:ATP-dependent RNA helicase MSS116